MTRLALHWEILIGMAVGALLGIGLNQTVSDYEHTQPNVKLGGQTRTLHTHDTPNQIEIELIDPDEQDDAKAIVARYLIDPSKADPNSLTSLDELEKKHPEVFQHFRRYGRSWARWTADGFRAIGKLFLRLLQMVAVPLILTSLITGVTGLGGASQLGRMFSRTVLYYVCTSLLAIVTGLVMVNLFLPGLRGNFQAPGGGEAQQAGRDVGDLLFEQLENMIPSNPFQAVAEGNFLPIISFSLAFGIFTILVGGRSAEKISELFQAGFDVMMSMTMAIIKLAPIGVLCLMLYATATQGIEVFFSLGWYMLTVLCALGVHALITLPLILYFITRQNPRLYAQAMSPALLTAFSSASSNATLPLTMTCVEKRAGVSNRVGSFVLPLGATVNMDGTALYEAVAVLFIAQLHFGHNLPLAQQILVALTALLASIGAAGIPHAGLVMMLVILEAVGLPTEMQGVIIAVDRVLDMCRTSVNVWSDTCGCAVIARFEGEPVESAPAEEELREEPT